MSIPNAAIAKALASICREHACECPVICTPEELMREFSSWRGTPSSMKFGAFASRQVRFRCQGNPCGLERATTSLRAQGYIVRAKKEVERLI
jgi:hypothetical protein